MTPILPFRARPTDYPGPASLRVDWAQEISHSAPGGNARPGTIGFVALRKRARQRVRLPLGANAIVRPRWAATIGVIQMSPERS